jgi:hypothetical protein
VQLRGRYTLTTLGLAQDASRGLFNPALPAGARPVGFTWWLTVPAVVGGIIKPARVTIDAFGNVFFYAPVAMAVGDYFDVFDDFPVF